MKVYLLITYRSIFTFENYENLILVIKFLALKFFSLAVFTTNSTITITTNSKYYLYLFLYISFDVNLYHLPKNLKNFDNLDAFLFERLKFNIKFFVDDKIFQSRATYYIIYIP